MWMRTDVLAGQMARGIAAADRPLAKQVFARPQARPLVSTSSTLSITSIVSILIFQQLLFQPWPLKLALRHLEGCARRHTRRDLAFSSGLSVCKDGLATDVQDMHGLRGSLVD